MAMQLQIINFDRANINPSVGVQRVTTQCTHAWLSTLSAHFLNYY